MPFQLPMNHKFSIIAFDDCIEVDLPSQVDLSEIAHVFPAPPFALPEHWRKYVGELDADHFGNANLAIVVHHPATTPKPAMDDIRPVSADLSRFVLAFMLNGVPDYSAATWFSGANDNGELLIVDCSELDHFYRLDGQRRPTIDRTSLTEAWALALDIARLYNSGQHLRLRMAFNELISGFKSVDARERLHCFVRSFDGLMALEPGKSTRQFVHRVRTFGEFAGGERDCRMFYDLRSASEHLNDWDTLLDPAGTMSVKQRNVLILAWADAAERLATFVFRRLLRSPALLAHLVDETTTRAFWRLPDDERQRLWGDKMPIGIETRSFSIALA